MRAFTHIFALLTAAGAALLANPAHAAELLPADASIEQAIDHYIDSRLAAADVSAAPQAGDANLLRRTMLDLVGRIPTVVEAKAFLAEQDPGKRLALVERLMASPAFVRQQAAEFDALLMRGSKGDLRGYLTTAFQENRSWDVMFREMLLGEADDLEQKRAIQFVKSRVKDVDKLTNDASVLFFGVNVSCAMCHDHPLVDDWKQEHYFGMKSFFNRTYEAGNFIGEKEHGLVEYKTVAGEAHTAKLMFLTGDVLAEPAEKAPSEEDKKRDKDRKKKDDKDRKEPPPPPTYSRRARLVDVALQRGADHYFSRAIVNHLWNRFFGRGLVMPVDQLHSENAPSHPELLDWLARDMQSHRYDLRRLMRGMALSRAYARSSQWDSAAQRPADDLFAVGIVRPLSPWQYGASLRLGSTSPEQFPDSLSAEQFDQRMLGIENAGRALASSLEVPGEDFQVSVDEALLFSNNERVTKELLRENNDSLLSKLAQLGEGREIAETAVWCIMARPAAEDEIQSITTYLTARGDRASVAREQMVWALLTSGECRFNY